MEAMEAMEFMRELHRMCMHYKHSCRSCPLLCDKCHLPFLDSDIERSNVITTVKKWSEDHPIKTRQSEFLKMFPDVEMPKGVINLCPRAISGKEPTFGCDMRCRHCEKRYWLEPLPEVNNRME